jgi:hypothetical protein
MPFHHSDVKCDSGILSSCSAIKKNFGENSVCHPPQG